MSFAREGRLAAILRWIVTPFLAVVLYVLSSGPVLGTAFRLRESTHNDNFYVVMWVYYPLFVCGHGPDSPAMRYIEWWVVDVFDTVGPG